MSLLEESLRRLRTDYVDLYQLHSPPAEVLNRGDVFSVLDQMKRTGEVRAIGVSCLTAQDARMCLGVGLDAVQIETSINSASDPNLLSQLCADNIAVIGRQGLAGVTKTEANGECQVDPSMTIRYLTHHVGLTSLLIGTSRVDHLVSNAQAASAGKLSPEQLHHLGFDPRKC